MEHRIAALEAQVETLQDEVSFLRRELTRLRAEREAARSSSSSGSFSVVTNAQGGERGAGYSSPLVVPPVNPPLVNSADPAATSGRGPPGPDRVLTWAERERICDEIALWILRALDGQHRGTSSRDQIPLSSRIWIVARDFQGRDCNPVLVFSSFSSYKEVVKRGSELGDSIFIGLPSQREAARVVLAAGLTWPADGPRR